MTSASHRAVLVLLVLLCATASARAQTLFFDSFEPPGFFSVRGVGDSPGSLLTPSKDVVITNIAVRNDLSTAGNMRFLIFDHATSALLFATDPKIYPANGMTWKTSESFYFVLRAGVQYDIGAIADVAGDWAFDGTATTQGGVSSATQNPNFSNFANPVLGSPGGADGATRLYGLEYPQIFDAFEPSGSSVLRGAGSAPGVEIQVDQDVILTNIEVLNQMGGAGNLRFLIFEHPSETLVFASDPMPYPADGAPTWKKSPPMYFQLRAGQSYDIGAIADVGADWDYDVTPTNERGIIRSVSSNPNFSNFASPTSGGHAGADAAVRLHGAPNPLLFDSFDGSANVSFRNAGSAPGSLITPSQSIVVNNIAVRNDLDSAGNLRFLIFEHPSETLVYASDPVPYPADASPSWKKSPPFAFVLQAGQQYDIGAIADVSAFWSFDNSAGSQAGLASTVNNPNFSDFANPTSGGHSAADAAVQLFTAGLHIIDPYEPPPFLTTNRPAEDAPGTLFTVNNDRVISNIAVLNQLGSAGNLRFLIFEHPSETLIYASNPIAFPADTAPTWKTSSLPVAIKLLAGNQYDIGAIPDVASQWPLDNIPTAEPTIASESNNPNFSVFASPVSSNHACCDTGVRLLPEPASGLSLVAGTALLAGLNRRRRACRRA